MKKPVKPPKAPANKGPADDEAVWQHVTRSVKPLARKKPASAAAGKKAQPSPNAAAAKSSPVKTPSVKISPIPAMTLRTTPVPPKPALNKGFDKSTETKMKKGKLEIEGRIDLHGMNQAEAYAALSRFIRASENAGRRMLLVITGKGRLGGGVLRRALPLWLEDSDFGRSVLAITKAAPKDGGDGAFYIRLRKPKD